MRPCGLTTTVPVPPEPLGTSEKPFDAAVIPYREELNDPYRCSPSALRIVRRSYYQDFSADSLPARNPARERAPEDFSDWRRYVRGGVSASQKDLQRARGRACCASGKATCRAKRHIHECCTTSNAQNGVSLSIV